MLHRILLVNNSISYISYSFSIVFKQHEIHFTAKAFPQTTTETPIFLYSSDDTNVQLPPQLELPKFPVFLSTVSVENDASLAKVSDICTPPHH